MKQKYLISIDDQKDKLTLKEFSELDKDILSLICEETYDIEALKEAMAKSKMTLVQTLRTKNMFPPNLYMEDIADQIIELCKNGGTSSELFLDDIEFLLRDREAIEAMAIDDEASDIDDLLDDSDEISDDFGDDDTITNISSNSSIKIADDDSLDIEDEG